MEWSPAPGHKKQEVREVTGTQLLRHLGRIDSLRVIMTFN